MAKFLFCYFTLILMLELHYEDVGTAADCESKIHRECLHDSSYTDADLDIVLQFYNTTFRRHATNKTLCKKLYVRKDFKCLNQTERDLFVEVFLNLSANGVIANLTKFHDYYWPMGHKTSEGLSFHRWVVLTLELIARKTFPDFTMPYWELYQESCAPHKSMVWDTLGRPNNGGTGSPDTDYCIASGPFKDLTVYYPNTHCLKRQWETDGTIRPWEPAEWATSFMQLGIALEVFIPILITVTKAIITHINTLPANILLLVKVLLEILKSLANPTVQPWPQFAILNGFTGHFIYHLSIGGLAGDLSFGYGTNDPTFYLLHGYQADYIILKWQLSRTENNVPSSYTEGYRLTPNYDFYLADLDEDILTFFNVPIKDTFTFGFGDLCYVHDQLIAPIKAYVANGYKPVYTTPASVPAYQRLQNSLPRNLLKKYFPKFASNTATFFDYALPNVGECNTGPNCNPIKYWDYFSDTLNGRLHAVPRFKYDGGVDIYDAVLAAENFDHTFRDRLNSCGYCSPYCL